MGFMDKEKNMWIFVFVYDNTRKMIISAQLPDCPMLPEKNCGVLAYKKTSCQNDDPNWVLVR